ncbi:MAG: alkaline phosphatase [Bauldia sp.]|nr:alkaline phosphatase [Bauldia sp.]
MLRHTAALLAGVSTLGLAGAAIAQDLPQANDSYFTSAAADLEEILARQPIEGQARNIILFVGDGMSIPTTTAARILEGQDRGVDGESNSLAVDTFPYVALSRTYGNDAQVSDSAPTATAMVSGVKTNAGIIGLNGSVAYQDCAAAAGNEVKTIFEMAEEAGWETGIISTARIVHATPAAAYAHTADRNWESSAPEGCRDIAAQLIEWPFGDGFEVVLGGGRNYFMPNTMADPEDEGRTGNRQDGRDLTAEWTSIGNDHVFIWNAEQFAALDLSAGQSILGLFEGSHMEYEADREGDTGGEPSLAEMTAAAIERLLQSENGFVLMVEGGRIDHAHHAGNAARALYDTIAFNAAIQTALDMTSREDTLIVVTADHSHSMTINGYPDRGNPILGVVREGGEVVLAADGKPFTTLSYANGPGGVFPALADGQTEAEGAAPRQDLTDVDTTDIDYLQQALVPIGSETHTGDDVAIYAWGPWAHLFSGTVEQNLIYHVMSYASGLGRE